MRAGYTCGRCKDTGYIVVRKHGRIKTVPCSYCPDDFPEEFYACPQCRDTGQITVRKKGSLQTIPCPHCPEPVDLDELIRDIEGGDYE